MVISKEQQVQINEEIRDKEVRVIGSDGGQLGIMSASEALDKAAGAKIMDYGKYRFEQQKREKEAKKNQRTFDIKEVRLSLGIDTHDFDTKVKQAAKFVQGGDKVKATIRFKGRELGHPEHGLEIMRKFAEALAEVAVVDEALAEVAVVEKPAKLEGRSMMMFLAAKPNK